MSDQNASQSPDVSSPAPNSEPPQKTTVVGSVVRIAAAIIVLVLLIGMLLPAKQSGNRGHGPRPPCLLNLRQISLAMTLYSVSKMRFPPAYLADENGKPMHSWRVLLLPYLEQEDLYNRYSFDEPWDGPNNSKLHDEIVDVYHCPHDKAAAANETSYMVVVGKGTGFDGSKEISIGKLIDGWSNTLAIIEVKSSNAHWMEPVDLPIEEAIARYTDQSTARSHCNHSGRVNIASFDGSTHALAVPVDPKQFRSLIEISDGNVVDVIELLSGR